MTAHCLWCHKEIGHTLQLRELLLLKPIQSPILCPDCLSQLPRLEQQPVCKGCGRLWQEKEPCPDCQRWKLMYPSYAFHNEALFQYTGLIKEMIEAYKFKGDYRLNLIFAEPLQQLLKRKEVAAKGVVPVPVSQRSLATRGFNQVTGLLDAARQPYLDIMVNTSMGEKQSKKDRKQRMETRQPFQIKEAEKEFIEGKDILLVDDVYTTGRTLFHGADCLLKNGARSVETITLAR